VKTYDQADRREPSMRDYEFRGANDLSLPGKRARNSEWEGIIDRIEEAIVLSLANKVLENAGIKEEKVGENRRKVRVVELRGFPRKQAN
jgi:hypothetical protein